MKLFLMRHAQAEEEKGEGDILRALTEIGKNEAFKAAESLASYHIDKIIVSPAARTLQTAEIIQNKVKCKKYEILPELYASSSKKIIEIISKQDSVNKSIIVIAHNPGIFKAALHLINEELRYEELLHQGMHTARIVALDFPDLQSWTQIASENDK